MTDPMDPTTKAVAVLPRRDRIGRRIGRRQGRTEAEKAQAQVERIAQLMHEMWVEATSAMIAHVPEQAKARIASKLVAWDDLHPSTRRSLVARAEKVIDDLHRVAKAAPTFTPPKSVQANARQALQWREEHPDEIRGMTRVGWTRANQLASGEPISLDTVQRMAQFNRHRDNATVDEAHRDTPWKDAGRVAWLGWGGDEGIAWAKRVLAEQAQKAEDHAPWADGYGLGTEGICQCPECGAKVEHETQKRCNETECPECGAKMVRAPTTKAMNEGTPEEGGNTVPTTTGLNIEIRDRYRTTQLRRLPDDDLIKAHDELHELFGKRPEGAAVERYVNSHVQILAIFAEREIPHPKPPKGTAELDKLTLSLQKAARGDRKTRTTLEVRTSGKDMGRPVEIDEVLQFLDRPFRLVPVYLTGGVVLSGDEGTTGDVDLVIPQFDTLPEWLQWAIGFRLTRGAAPDLEGRIAVMPGVVGPPIADHVLLGHIGYLPVEGDLEVVEMSAEPVATEGDESTHKASDPYTEYPDKPAQQLAVLQVHAIGKGRHLDLRMQLNRDELVGWTLFAGTQGAEGEDAQRLTDAREMLDGYTTDDGNAAIKPLRSPAKLGATPKSTQPAAWLQVQGVMDPGEAGATADLPGVFAMAAGPDKLSCTWGAQKDDFHEYFLEVDGSDPHDLAGVWSFRAFEGTGREGDDEVSSGRKTPAGKRAWVATIEDDPVPYVLSPRAVELGWMPPDGQHALPVGIAEKLPERLHYWRKTGDEARKVRDFLVSLNLVTPDTVEIEDGQFHLREQEQKTALGAGADPDAVAPAGEDPLPGAVPITKALRSESAWLGPRRPDGSRMLKAVVYSPLELDAHGDWTTGEVIVNAQIFHSLKGMRLNLEHNRNRERLPSSEAKVVQTYTSDVTFKVTDLHGQQQVIPADSWIMAAILRGSTLRKAERGQINGWSFEGLARSARVR